MLNTSQLRSSWAPACTGPFVTINLYGEGRVSVRSAVIPAIKALNEILATHKYKTRKADTGAYNCRRITGGSGYSLHAYGIAVDINWTTNPYGKTLKTDMPPAMVKAIKALRTNSGKQVFGWGGDYKGNKDAMHFEIVCSPNDLASGIRGTTHPVTAPAAPGWRPFQAGATDKSIYESGGNKHEVSEVQLILSALARRWSDTSLHPGAIDGSYGPTTQKAVSAFKKRVIAFQKAAKVQPWPNSDSFVGPATIGALRFWNQASAK